MAQYESELGVQFCYECLLRSASFLGQRDMLESNPLCEVLFRGVWRITDSTYEVWFRTKDGACRPVWLES